MQCICALDTCNDGLTNKDEHKMNDSFDRYFADINMCYNVSAITQCICRLL